MADKTWYAEDFLKAFNRAVTEEDVWNILNEHQSDFDMILYTHFGDTRLPEIIEELGIEEADMRSTLIQLMKET